MVDDVALVVDREGTDGARRAEGGAYGDAGGGAADGGAARCSRSSGGTRGPARDTQIGPSGARQRLSGIPGRFSAKGSLRPALAPVSQ